MFASIGTWYNIYLSNIAQCNNILVASSDGLVKLRIHIVRKSPHLLETACLFSTCCLCFQGRQFYCGANAAQKIESNALTYSDI